MARDILRSVIILITRVWKRVTVEPVAALSHTALGLNEIMRPNLLLDLACMQKLNYSREFCNNITDSSVFGNNMAEFQDELEAVQRVVSNYERNYNLIAFVPRILFALVAGPWSDRHGRKLLIVAPLLGQAITNAVLILCYTFLSELPFEALYLELINELCGSNMVYLMGLFCYVSDITTAKARFSRLAVIEGIDHFFSMVAYIVCVPIYKAHSFDGIFGLACGLCIFGFFYAILVIPNVVVASKEVEVTDQKDNEKTIGKSGNEHKNGSERSRESKGLRLNDLIDSFRTIFKKRPEEYRRLIVLLLVANFSLYTIVQNGTDGTHRYFFAMRKYGWDETEFRTYLIIFNVANVLVLWVLLPICGRLLTLHEATVTIICCVLSSIGQLLPAVFSPSWVFYACAILAAFSSQPPVGARTMASIAVGEQEVGRAFSIFVLMAAAGSSLMLAAYQQLYSATLDGFVGAFLVLNATLLIVTIPANLLLWKKLN